MHLHDMGAELPCAASATTLSTSRITGRPLRRRLPLVALLLATLSLGACSTYSYGPGYGYGPNEVGGTLLGAAAGGLIGSAFGGGAGKVAATAVGTLAGAALGNTIGASIDQSNRYGYPGYAYAPGGYVYNGDPYNSAYMVGGPPVVPNTIQNNVFSVPAVQYQYPTYREVIWAPVSDTTVYRQGSAPLTADGCTRVYNNDGRIMRYCPDRFGGWSLRP